MTLESIMLAFFDTYSLKLSYLSLMLCPGCHGCCSPIDNVQVRNYLMCLGLFVGVAAVWACCIYGVAGAVLFRGRGRPPLGAMARQVGVSDCSPSLW